MRKLLSLIFVTMMLVSSTIAPVFAAEPTGTITIENAENGKTYHLVKVFDAQVSASATGTTDENTPVTYTLDKTVNESLYNLIKNDIGAGTIENPFELTQIGNVDAGVYQVSHKTVEEGQSREFGRGWLYALYGEGEGKWKATEVTKTLASTEYNTLSFDNLSYGYYMIYKTNAEGERGQIASVVSLISSQSKINDKNPRVPGDVEKKIVYDNGTTATEGQVQIGDVVKYQASFMAVNYVVKNGVSNLVESYKLRDEAKGLKYKALNSIKFYTGKNDNGFTGEIKSERIEYSDENPAPYEADVDLGGYSMVLDWVDENGDPKYPSPVYVVCDYEMIVTEKILLNANNNTATNTFDPSYVIDGEPTPITPNPPHVEVYTSGISITKTDGNGNVLTGAKFILSKVETVDGKEVETFYNLVTEKSETTHEEWKKVEWTTKEKALVVDATNNEDSQAFGGLVGLEAGTYRLYEVESPKGYDLPDADDYWEITITYKKGEAEPFSAIIRKKNSNNTSALPLVKGDGENSRKYFLATIVNEGGKALPQTGAEGTTRMLMAGGAMFAITMLVLVTKKRLYNQG